MTEKIKPKDRRQALGMTIEEVAGASGLNANIVARIEATGEPPGALLTYERALTAFEEGEAPPAAQPEWKATQDAIGSLGYIAGKPWQEQPTRAAQNAARQAQFASIQKWRAEQEAKEAAAREVANQKIRDAAVARANLGIRLTELREQAGITLKQMSAMTHVPADILGRMERGVPVGYRNTEAIIEAYSAMSFLGPGGLRRAGIA
jgi:transcriptional regulator with XRE-family HTH domain